MSKYTRKAIIATFMKLLQKKSFDQITVKEIIESAEINRNTFYYYFQDIYDLLEHMFRDESEKFRSEADPDSTFEKEYRRLADSFYQDKYMILHIYNSKGRPVLSKYLEQELSRFVLYFVEKSAGKRLSKEGLEYITCYYTYGMIGLTMWWMDNQMLKYEDGIIETISASFEDTIDVMIRSYIKRHPAECL